VGWIPSEVIGFFNWLNPSSCTVALRLTQPLTEMSTMILPGGKGRLARKVDNVTSICEMSICNVMLWSWKISVPRFWWIYMFWATVITKEWFWFVCVCVCACMYAPHWYLNGWMNFICIQYALLCLVPNEYEHSISKNRSSLHGPESTKWRFSRNAHNPFLLHFSCLQRPSP
jgi:hypothetical protein